MSDQWGQPQNPYGPYDGPPQQPQQPQQPQYPYGIPPTQPMPDPYAVPPTQPMPNPYDPYGQQQPPPPGYGYPPPPPPQQQQQPQPQQMWPYPPQPQQYPQPYPHPPAAKKNQNMIISGAVVAVLVIAAAVFLLAKGSGGSTNTTTQAQSCAAWKAEQDTMNNQNPGNESDLISELGQDLPAMQAIVQNAGTSPFKPDMAKVTADFTQLQTYLQANPNLDPSSSTPPAAFVTIDESITADITTLDSLCGLPNPAASANAGI